MAAEFFETTAEGYRADPSLSQSKIKDFIRDPQQFYRSHVARSDPPKPPTKAMTFGSDVERLAFYGRLPAVVIPNEVLQTRRAADGTVSYARSGAAWQQWQARAIAEHGPDVKLLKSEEYADVTGPILQAVDGLRGHAYAHRLIWSEQAIKHVRMRWVDEITGLPCKCELDILDRTNVIADLKTAADVSLTGFQRSVVKFGYYLQSWFYREALKEIAKHMHRHPDTEMFRACRPVLERILDKEPPMCCWVAVKNSPSYHAEVHPVDEEWYTIAEQVARRYMFEIKRCYDTGRWQTATHGTITDMKVPKFAFNVIEELSSGDEA